MKDIIGTISVCVTDPNKSYIVGASETANENFRKNIRNEHLKVPEGAVKFDKDSYEKAGIREVNITIDEYYNMLEKQITGMPGSCLGDNYGNQVRNEVFGIMDDYYSNQITKDDVMSKIKDICKDMRVYQAQSHHTTGYNKEDNLQILSDIYEIFQKANVNNAVGACFDKGEEIARQNGGSEKSNWVYYDSEFYYKSVEIRECLKTAVSELAKEWKVDDPDYNKIEENTKYVLDGKLDFNSCWNWSVMQRGVSEMKYYDDVPPKDFSFFYQANK